MSKYTTGEMAKLCGVTVRTVQYYDARGILIPSELSEGGRRLYSEDDLKRLKVICFLRELDIPIDAAMVFHHFLDRQRHFGQTTPLQPVNLPALNAVTKDSA